MSETSLLTLTAQIVAAYVSRNDVPRNEVARLVGDVHAALQAVGNGTAVAAGPDIRPQKSPIKKSIFPDYLVCLEDGKRFKSLKRHLRVKYSLTPEQYRTKWSLAADYPMVAPRYAETRSKLAKSMGLGRKSKKRR
ncbi:MAG: MucR family transcriptional regulator [Phyllobacteriaceae bacterium]|mgnify:CR=1 FL=1|jgi:predicted transcriptional regulator|nr:MucR family transcriptional regulator [Phyllobacteriaceae bacterium]